MVQYYGGVLSFVTLSDYLEQIKTTGCAHCSSILEWVDDGNTQYQECFDCCELVWLINGDRCVTDHQLETEDPELWDQLHAEFEPNVN